ncbi:barstar family protein [Paraliomyxa miuraensis]|uniref:barstar family protein n=1 Tax=Paraliomyxa miuraensis TaxID=376150 RepID=UPI00224D9A49|nr:barstar family protein [Paraliomyxa miuraensis]MCX4245067.1 barstar family protein [Paraliomyxa miuraensis]
MSDFIMQSTSEPLVLLELEDHPDIYFSDVEGLEGQFRLLHGDGGHLLAFMGSRSMSEEHPWVNSCHGRPVANNASLVFRTVNGDPFFRHFLGPMEPIRVFGPKSDGSVAELVVRASCLHPLPPGTATLARSWRQGLPAELNRWATLTFHARRAWLRLVTGASTFRRPETSPTRSSFVLDGRYATDYPGVLLALGEAVNGPCGYYGADLDAVEDCLSGGFGPTPPFTLVWKHFGRFPSEGWAREQFWRLATDLVGVGGDSFPPQDMVADLLELLRVHSVTVLLE